MRNRQVIFLLVLFNMCCLKIHAQKFNEAYVVDYKCEDELPLMYIVSGYPTYFVLIFENELDGKSIHPDSSSYFIVECKLPSETDLKKGDSVKINFWGLHSEDNNKYTRTLNFQKKNDSIIYKDIGYVKLLSKGIKYTFEIKLIPNPRSSGKIYFTRKKRLKKSS